MRNDVGVDGAGPAGGVAHTSNATVVVEGVATVTVADAGGIWRPGPRRCVDTEHAQFASVFVVVTLTVLVAGYTVVVDSGLLICWGKTKRVQFAEPAVNMEPVDSAAEWAAAVAVARAVMDGAYVVIVEGIVLLAARPELGASGAPGVAHSSDVCATVLFDGMTVWHAGPVPSLETATEQPVHDDTVDVTISVKA